VRPVNPIIEINGALVTFADPHSTAVNGNALAPYYVFEDLGFGVAWNANTQQVTLSRNDDTIAIEIGRRIFTANGLRRTSAIPAQIINGRTMLPIRAILESAGYSVYWNEARNAIVISGDYT
jgi:hypothetical protein